MNRLSPAHLLKLVVALVVTIGMLVSSFHVTTSHNPIVLAQAEAARHAELAIEIAEHGHSHFDGEEAEQLPGHLHGHNSADHNHDAANVFPTHVMLLPSPIRVTLPSIHDSAGSGLRHGLDRPPRTIVA